MAIMSREGREEQEWGWGWEDSCQEEIIIFRGEECPRLQEECQEEIVL